MRETADIDTSNNFWTASSSSETPSKFQVFKQKQKMQPEVHLMEK
jgi:hypothetical protein